MQTHNKALMADGVGGDQEKTDGTAMADARYTQAEEGGDGSEEADQDAEDGDDDWLVSFFTGHGSGTINVAKVHSEAR